MMQVGTYAQVKIAFIVIGIALMSALGGATFAHTHDRTATAIALLVGAAALTVYGRRILRWWWAHVMLGLDTPYSEPTREYESTTRAEKLAPKIVRMIETAEGPVTVITTGVEPPPTDGAPDAWADALRSAARAGTTVRVLLAPGTTAEEAVPAHALADTYPGCKVFAIANPARPSVVAPGEVSPSAQDKARRKRTASGEPVHSFRTLLDDLATVANNRVVAPLADAKPFDLITRPTALQRKAFKLLGVRLERTQ